MREGQWIAASPEPRNAAASAERLTLKKGYEAIHRGHFAKQPNVGRSTFYAHYTGKDDLKRSGLEHLRQQLLDHQRAALAAWTMLANEVWPSVSDVEHAREHIDCIGHWCNHGGAVALAPSANSF